MSECSYCGDKAEFKIEARGKILNSCEDCKNITADFMSKFGIEYAIYEV